jgi:hypothetical protein
LSFVKGAIVNRYLSYYHPALQRYFRLPFLHVRYHTATASFSTLALVDSGATDCFLPTDFAEILGLQINPAEAHPSIGAGGGFQSVVFKPTIELLKGGQPFAIFEDWPVHVPLNRDAIPYAILGRDSVFMKFDITFRERIQRTILRHAKVKVKKSSYERRY